MSKLVYVEFGTLVKNESSLELEQQVAMPIANWLETQKPLTGTKELTAKLAKEGWTIYLAVPTRPQIDKVAMQEWLAAQELNYSRLDLPRNLNTANLNLERWVVSRLHDLSEFDEPAKLAALLRPETLHVLNQQLSGPLMDWQPKGLLTATTIEQANKTFLGGLRTLSVRPA